MLLNMILMTLYELHFKTSKEQDRSKVDLKTSCLCSDIAGVIFGFYREINLDQMFPNKESVIEKSSAKY